MRKIYKLNKQMNSARIILNGKTGNEVIYNFTNGNVITSTPARITLNGKYDQDLLEQSELFKDRTIILERVIETEEDKAQKENEKRDGMEKVEDIKSVTEAISYVAEHFDMKATSARNALEIAEANGVTFPNLKLGKK